MLRKLMIALMMTLSLALFSPQLLAQPQGGGKQPAREMNPPQVDQDRMRDRDMDRDMDRDRMRAMDRIHQPRDMHGYMLLTQEERQTFRNELRSAETAEQRREVASRHRELVLQRAEKRGVDLANRPLMGRELLTAAERREFRERMMNAETEAERERIRAAHREMILQRQREEDGG